MGNNRSGTRAQPGRLEKKGERKSRRKKDSSVMCISLPAASVCAFRAQQRAGGTTQSEADGPPGDELGLVVLLDPPRACMIDECVLHQCVHIRVHNSSCAYAFRER